MKIEDIDRQFQELARQMKEGEGAFTRGDFEEAIQLFSPCLPLLVSAYGEGHEESQLCMDRLANSHYALHHYDEVLPILRRLIAAKLRNSEAESADLPQLYFVLARTNTRLGKWEDADDCYKSALGLAEKQFGKRSSFVAAILEGHAALLRLDGSESVEAFQLQEKAREVRASLVDQAMSSRMNKLSILARYAENIEGKPGEDRSPHSSPRNTNSNLSITSKKDARTTSQSLTGLRALEPEPAPRTGRLPISILMAIIIFAGVSFLFIGDGATRLSDLLSQLQSRLSLGTEVHKDSGSITHSSEDAAKASQFFASLDGRKRLTIKADNSLSMEYPGIYLTGASSFSDGQYSFKPEKGGSTFLFRTSAAGIVDFEGSLLYPQNAPELLVAAKMRTLAKVAQQYYMQFHQYPSKSEAIVFSAPELTYTNPVSGARMSPVLGSSLGVAERSIKDFGLDDYAKFENGIIQLSQANGQPMIGPCAIEFYNIKYLRQGETFFIRGTDRNGRLLPGSSPSKAYVIVLNQGRISG